MLFGPNRTPLLANLTEEGLEVLLSTLAKPPRPEKKPRTSKPASGTSEAGPRPSEKIRKLINAETEDALKGREYEKLVLDMYDKLRRPAAKRPLPKKRGVRKLKAKLVPGSVVIVLKGVYTGRRVIFLKQLSSGHILLAGPKSVNGVPLFFTSQKYVIVTSTQVPLEGLNLPAELDDSFFRKPAVKKSKKFLEEDASKGDTMDVGSEESAISTQVDSDLTKIVDQVPMMRGYLASKFTLNSRMAPHRMKF